MTAGLRATSAGGPSVRYRPAAMTTTRPHSRDTISILCSISRIDFPRALRSSTRSMISSSSVGLTPAAGSSSRIACGIGHQDARQLEQLALAARQHARRFGLQRRERDEVQQSARPLDRRLLLRGNMGRAAGNSSRCARRTGPGRRSARSPAPSSPETAAESGRYGRPHVRSAFPDLAATAHCRRC